MGHVVCTQELQQQWAQRGLHFDQLAVGSGSSGTHGGLVAGCAALGTAAPVVGIGVSRDPADQEPLVLREAQAVLLDSIYTGKAMAGVIGLARQGVFKPDERLLFLQAGDLPAVHAHERVLLGDAAQDSAGQHL